MPRQDEEGFCEYMAFTAVERGARPPGKALLNLPTSHLPINEMIFLADWDWNRNFYPQSGSRAKIPLMPWRSAMKPDYFRICALCVL